MTETDGSESLREFYELSPKALRAIEEALARNTGDGMPETLELSNGIKLKLKPTPPFIFEDALAGLVPRPPVVTVPGPDGPREEENPVDPDYLDAVDAYTQERLKVVFRLAVMAGTELLELPEGMEGPDGEDWEERLRVIKPDIDVPPRERRAARYFAWLRWVALQKVEDIALVTGLPLIIAGISETEVAGAMSSFRGDG